MTTKTKRMTEAEAQCFERVSIGNAARVLAALSCDCQPYQDVYTYRRWQSQGMQVRRGEKAIRLPHVRTTVSEDEDGNEVTGTYLGTSAVFCRCQVDAK